DLFQKVQERLKSNRAAPSRTRATEEYLLTTKLFCGHCQAMMAGISGTGKAGTKYHYYSCNNARIKKCNKHNVKKDDIEKAVLDAAKAMLTNENISLIAEEVVKICEKESESPTFLITQNQLKDNERQKSNLMAALRTGSADESVTLMILEELNQLSEATHILETKIAAEKLRQVEISVPRIKFFLSQLAEGKMDDKHYKKYLVNIFVNKIYVFDDGHGTAFFNTQKEPVAIDFNLFKAAEKSFETCSPVTQFGSPRIWQLASKASLSLQGTPKEKQFIFASNRCKNGLLLFWCCQSGSQRSGEQSYQRLFLAQR
ncbi:MAG: zinc ribbon domain-containing protein, partial [Oscillospiraceae bacterium]